MIRKKQEGESSGGSNGPDGVSVENNTKRALLCFIMCLALVALVVLWNESSFLEVEKDPWAAWEGVVDEKWEQPGHAAEGETKVEGDTPGNEPGDKLGDKSDAKFLAPPTPPEVSGGEGTDGTKKDKGAAGGDSPAAAPSPDEEVKQDSNTKGGDFILDTFYLPSDPSIFQCQEPTKEQINPKEQMRNIVDTIIGEPDIHIVYSEMFVPQTYVFPPTHSEDVKNRLCTDLCNMGGAKGWRVCDPEEKHVKEAHLHVALTPCSFVDSGWKKNTRGVVYNADSYMSATFTNQEPNFRHTNIKRFEKIGNALHPSGHNCKSHFFVDNLPYVLTLYEALPPDIPILISWSPCLAELYGQLSGLDMSRFVHFDESATYYATEMYSLVPSPYGYLSEYGVERQSAQSVKRVRKYMGNNVGEERGNKLILIGRSDTAVRNCRNHPALKAALEENFGSEFEIVNFVGTKQSKAQNMAIFKQASIIVAPHGGALLNIIYAPEDTGIVEIGYWGKNTMCFPIFYCSWSAKMDMDYWLLMGEGEYNAPIDCPIDDVVQEVKNIIENRKGKG